MQRFSRISSLLAVTVLLAAIGTTSAEDDPSIKEVMTKAHKKGDGILSKVGEDLKGDKVNWEDATKLSKELVGLGEALGKAKPPQGEQSSWDKLTKSYTDNAKKLLAATEKKDQKDASATLGALSKSCGGCHSAHKPKK